MEGWIKLHRQITTSSKFADADMLRLWVLCLAKAAHREVKVVIDKREITLQPGEFVTGRFSLCDEFNAMLAPRKKIKDTTLWSWLKRLEQWGDIDIKPTNKYSVISIVKWSEYQSTLTTEPQQNDNKLTAESQQTDTNKNVKNAEKQKEPRPKPTKPVYDEDSIPYRLANYLLTNILQFKPDLKQPNLQSWADDMRKLVELDKREPKEVGNVIKWVTKDPFWQINILSASTLREKWDKVTARMKSPGKQPQKTIVDLPLVTVTDEESDELARIRRRQQESNIQAAVSE